MAEHKEKVIYTILGPSGSGKTTLGNFMNDRLNVPECISTTTRKMRKGEKEGDTYYFVELDEFEKLKKVEEAEYAGNHYCLTKQEIERKLNENDQVFVIMERHGIEQMKKLYPELIEIIYIYTNPLRIIKRMWQRGDSLKNILSRVWNAIKTKEFQNHDYADYVIKNHNLNKAKLEISKIVNKNKNQQKKVS